MEAGTAAAAAARSARFRAVDRSHRSSVRGGPLVVSDPRAVAEPERGDELAEFHARVGLCAVEAPKVEPVGGGDVAVRPRTDRLEPRLAGGARADDVLLKRREGRVGGELE